MTEDDLALQQQMLDVMPELNDQRGQPPAPRPPDETGQQDPQAGQHDDGVAIVQHLGVHQPREPLAQHTPRLVQGPVQHVRLVRLHEVLGQVRQDDGHEELEGALVPQAVELGDERGSRQWRSSVCHGRWPLNLVAARGPRNPLDTQGTVAIMVTTWLPMSRGSTRCTPPWETARAGPSSPG